MSGAPIARRGLLAASAALALPAADRPAETADPVLGHVRQFLALQAESDQLNHEIDAIRTRIATRQGPPNLLPNGAHTWDEDCEMAHLRRLLQRDHPLCVALLRAQEAILSTPPTTQTGARAAVRYALSQLPPPGDEVDEWEMEVVRAVLANLAAFLGDDGAATRPTCLDSGGCG